MQITAQMVKQLRERSGAGMMECKNALVEFKGDIDAAMEHLRKTGVAKADKRSGRIAAEGVIVLAESDAAAALVEINSETDFVARDESFLEFANQVATLALDVDDVATLAAHAWPAGGSVDEARHALIAQTGENLQVRRMVRMPISGNAAAYVHGSRIGVLVELEGGSAELARGIAMHVAAMNPTYISPDQVPQDFIDKEKEIALALEAESGKPANIVEKIIEGKLRKTLAEISLTGQPYVLDTDLTVGKALEAAGAKVVAMHRLAVGEGIERAEEEDFATEVMKQAGLN